METKRERKRERNIKVRITKKVFIAQRMGKKDCMNTNVNADRNIFKSGTPTVTFQNPSLSSPPVSPLPSAPVVAQQKFLHQKIAQVQKQLQTFKTCHIKFTTSNDYQHYYNELSKIISEYGMLPLV